MEHKVPDDQQILEEYFNLATNKKTKKLSWLYGMVATFGLDPDQLNGFTWNNDYSINLKNRKKAIHPLHPQWTFLFELKEKPKIETESVAIHFRGTDFFGWNPDAVLGEDYYMNALSEIENDVESFYIFTDDETLPSYKGVVEYLNQNNRKVIFGENTANRNNYIKDFSTISECDYIISSPSTYCIAAGFIGKEKKIIHSEKWIHNRVDVDDKFWVDLNNGGNSDYSIWRLV